MSSGPHHLQALLPSAQMPDGGSTGFEQRFAQLDPIDRTIVEVAAVFYEPVSRSGFLSAFRSLGIRDGTKAFKSQTILPRLNRLVGEGLLRGSTHWSVPQDYLHLVVMQLQGENRLADLSALVQRIRPYRRFDDPGTIRHIREVRLALYLGNFDRARDLLSGDSWILGEICRPFSATWVYDFPEDLKIKALISTLEAQFRTLQPADAALRMLLDIPKLNVEATRCLVEQLIWRGRLDEAQSRLRSRTDRASLLGAAWLLTLRGDWSAAIDLYKQGLPGISVEAARRNALPSYASPLFYAVALMARGGATDLKTAETLSFIGQHGYRTSFPQTYQMLGHVLWSWEWGREAGMVAEFGPESAHPVLRVLQACCLCWTPAKAPEVLQEKLRRLSKDAASAGYSWLAEQVDAALLVIAQPDQKPKTHGVCLATAVRKPERWRRALSALSEAVQPNDSGATLVSAQASRLIWVVSPEAHTVAIEPREQRLSKSGSWTKGRKIALRRLHEDAVDWLSPEDRNVCRHITETVTPVYYGQYRDRSYTIDRAPALRRLRNATNVVTSIDGAWVSVEIEETKPILRITREASNGFRMEFEPYPAHDTDDFRAKFVTPTQIEFVVFDDHHHIIAKEISDGGMKVPAHAENELRHLQSKLSSVVDVQSDILAVPNDAKAVEPDSTVRWHVRSHNSGLVFQPLVRPLGEQIAQSFAPGTGPDELVDVLDGQPLVTRRDLSREEADEAAVYNACPLFADRRGSDGLVRFQTEVSALEALSTLSSLPKTPELVWTDGPAWQVSSAAGAEHLKVSLQKVEDLFRAKATLDLPGQDEVDVASLFGYFDASPGEYLRLGQDPQFLRITEELRQRIEELRALTDHDKLEFHPLTAHRLQDVLGSKGINGDAAWTEQCARLRPSKIKVAVPRSFKGRLRTYQQDGFRWLVRLGQWQAGACLADEMGLGKTVQSIALLLRRASEGPSLIVAPTSVVDNWADELQRFGPSLKACVYMGPNRGDTIAKLKPKDVLLTSYALLQQDAEFLTAQSFAVAILDEAQYIKNPRTRRAQAAFQLTALQRVALTGTPVENRLMELWSIFRFLNPGFLGTQASFQKRFVRPIEKDNDDLALERLRKLISPFVLRRLKAEVLKDLPPKTDHTHRVELELEELSLYEVIRDEALAEIQGLRGTKDRRIHLLAAIMRLRRAASNARLVLPDCMVPSAKLDALTELMLTHRKQGNRVLVFSQFVDHLQLVREQFDAMSIRYEYLDGSTTLRRRKQAIKAFQTEERDAFLISLRAGGFGLNLTAANQVIHMDPWWNPAVEDQASDRSHRIGQRRKVTVTRLVAKDTIEEGIVALHQKKRRLAVGLLQGADAVGGLSEQEMLQLIRGNKK